MAREEKMPKEVFNRLTSCDPGLAWQLCRNIACNQLLGEAPVPVPFLDEAFHYIPFGVIIKKSKKDLLAVDRHSYRIVGSLSTLAAPEMDKTGLMQQPRKVPDYSFNEKYVYACSDIKRGIKKSIKIKLDGVESYDVSLLLDSGAIQLDNSKPELKNTKKVYVIFEIFYAQSASVSVTIGEQVPESSYLDTTNRKFVHENRLPIAFNVQKFKVNCHGAIVAHENSSFEGMKKGTWKRVARLTSDPLPPVPIDEEDPYIVPNYHPREGDIPPPLPPRSAASSREYSEAPEASELIPETNSSESD